VIAQIFGGMYAGAASLQYVSPSAAIPRIACGCCPWLKTQGRNWGRTDLQSVVMFRLRIFIGRVKRSLRWKDGSHKGKSNNSYLVNRNGNGMGMVKRPCARLLPRCCKYLDSEIILRLFQSRVLSNAAVNR
jgi:hypothetical protein